MDSSGAKASCCKQFSCMFVLDFSRTERASPTFSLSKTDQNNSATVEVLHMAVIFRVVLFVRQNFSHTHRTHTDSSPFSFLAPPQEQVLNSDVLWAISQVRRFDIL